MSNQGESQDIVFRNGEPNSSRGGFTRNNHVKLIGSKKALDHISHVAITVTHAYKHYDCLVDLSDYEHVKDLVWRTDASRYARASVNGKTIYMHRLIMEKHGVDLLGKEVDHINRNRLDNRLSNLRPCDKVLNVRNVTKRAGSSSKYKGVCYSKKKSKWIAAVNVHGKCTFRKAFNDEIEAAKAYNEAALKYHKEFASLNEIP